MKYASKIYRRFIFTHEFFRFLMIDRVVIKKDNIVLITGRRGSGKTSFSIKIIDGFGDFQKLEGYYNKESNVGKEEKTYTKLGEFTPFDMERDMAFERKELQTLCKNTIRGYILADEAVVNVSRRNTMTRANKILHEILTINRKNYNTIFFCLPSIEDFDLAILQYINCWVHIDDRGLACVLLPNRKSIFGKKTWDIDHMKKVHDKYLEENPRATSVPYWLFDNFRGYIKFGQLPKALEKKYLDIANEKKNRDTDEEDKVVKPRLDEAKTILLKEIVDKLINGEIHEPADYYKYCGELGFKKEKLNKEVNEMLAASGDGRTSTKAIKDNHQKHEAKNESFNNKRYRF